MNIKRVERVREGWGRVRGQVAKGGEKFFLVRTSVLQQHNKGFRLYWPAKHIFSMTCLLSRRLPCPNVSAITFTSYLRAEAVKVNLQYL